MSGQGGNVGAADGTTTIAKRTRMLVGDRGRPFSSNVAIDGQANIFDLQNQSISEVLWPPTVVLDGHVISNSATPPYWFDYSAGVIVFFTAPQPEGMLLGVTGKAYDYFDDEMVSQAVIDAFNLHTADQDPLPYIDPVTGQCGLDSNDQYLVSILAAIELLWFRSTDAAQEVDVHTPEGVLIPRSQRYEQIMQQIKDLDATYTRMSGTLGTGLYRIQVLNQRRVSYTTNRLVPVFREQEYNQPYTGFFPTTGLPGTLITINGKYFSYATDVQFGGVSVNGNFTIVSDCIIQATVPNGALTGQIGVITSYGVVLSTAEFVVGEPPPFIKYGPSLVEIPIPPGK